MVSGWMMVGGGRGENIYEEDEKKRKRRENLLSVLLFANVEKLIVSCMLNFLSTCLGITLRKSIFLYFLSC